MIIRCDSCDSMLAVPDDYTEYWIEHHADGSHTHHMFAAWAGDELDSEGSEQ